MSTIAELNLAITGTVSGLEGAMSQATSMVESAGKKMTAAGKNLSVGVSAPLTLLGGLAVNASNTLNESLGNVQSLGVAQDAIVEYKESIQDMAVAVNKETGDLADGLYQVISAFGENSDTVGVLEINAKAAAAGLASTTDAINLTSAVTKGYGDTSQDAVQNVADLAFTTVKLGQTTFPELASSIGRVVPLGESLGVSMEELFGVMATGTGVTGSAAEVSTQLRGIFQSMAAPTGQMASLLEEWGYQSGSAAIEGMGLQAVIEGVTKEAEATGLPLQKYISSIEGQTLALALAGPQADKFSDSLSAMENTTGALDDAFTAQTEGINANGFALGQARQKWTVFLQDIGDGLAPFLTEMIDLLTPLADMVAGWAEAFSNLEPELQKVVGGIGLFLILLGPALVIAGQLVGAIAGLAPVFTALGTALGFVVSPLGLVVVGIAALIAFDVGGLRTAIVNLGTAAVETFSNFSLYLQAVMEDGDFLNDWLTELPAGMQPFAESIGRFIANWEDFAEAAKDAWTAVQWIFAGEGAEVDWWWDITGEIAESFNLPQEAADAWAVSLYDAGVKISGILLAVSGSAMLLWSALSGNDLAIEAFMEAESAILATFGPDAMKTFDDARRAIVDIRQAVIDLSASQELADLGTTFTTSLSSVGTAIQNVFAGEISFADFRSTIVTEVTAIGTDIGAVLESEAFADLKSGFSELFDAVGILEPLQQLQSDIQLVISQLTPYLEGPLSRLKEAFSGFSDIDFTPIIEGFTALTDAFAAIFSDEDATGAGGDILAALGITALQIGIESLVLIVQNAVGLVQGLILTIGNVLTLLSTVIAGSRDVIDAAVSGDMEGVIAGAQLILEGFVTFLGNQAEIVANLAGTILENITEFAGSTLEDIGIVFDEPEWLTDLLAWTDNMATPEWVTGLITWEWEQPGWVTTLLEFKVPRPGWLDSLSGMLDKLPGFLGGAQLGVAYAAQSGVRLVGENGPELQFVSRGDQIVPNQRTRSILGGGDVIVQQMIVRSENDIWRIAEELDAIKRRRS